ncbi:TetR/AcrR family transcriptional regulator [Nonomuraea sp. SBT364]|uniref:TetR/AcrR family transcriptional regulator n=1 Tax=Nonomuraea sp. SBT364 TaxID=1580530 RepID=UPI00066DC03A|nr:TetR family transcriptional regulator [Nonomuraea sp. SBT364]
MSGATRNPAERRRRIVRAACDLIPEVGVGGLTHRLVAARAGVPLGATTYYFRTLGDLVEAALEAAAEATDEGLRQWAAELAAAADVPARLAELTADYLGDRVRMMTWNEMYAAAGHRPELRPLARRWSDGLAGVLAEHTGARGARLAAVFVDGAVMHALIHDRPLDRDSLAESLTALMAQP